MPKDKTIKKVLVIGSGPIVIGQAAEFDYAGTQACLALKEEGCDIVLINNNPATIMTDEHIADTVYFEPLTVKNIEMIIEKEKPDGILATVSGQTGLNLAFDLNKRGILEKHDVKVLGTPIESIMQGEDRDKFRELMHQLAEPVPESEIVASLDEALSFSNHVGYPIIVRPAYTLGGSGGGIATGKAELIKYVKRGLRASPIQQCLIEKSIAGWKEIEFEVVRDADDTCIVVCHMENIDPVGIHTGDSVVVAPIQTLTTEEINRLREASTKIVRELGIIGACNVQLAYDSLSGDYFIIEVNPRVSRSSALASKATGYPIAKIATKLSLGYTLKELENGQMNESLATYEPELDYTVVKFPRWPFDKFIHADRRLGTQMKATGEVMAIEKTLEAALQKAIRSLELETDGLSLNELKDFSTKQLQKLVVQADDRRLFVILELMRRGISVDELYKTTKISPFFLERMHHLMTLEKEAKQLAFADLTEEQLSALKQNGFTDKWLASTWNVSLAKLKEKRQAFDIYPHFEKIIACTEQTEKLEAYYYSTWQIGKQQMSSENKKKALIIGSGPIRIGQGMEFDYCSVQGVLALQKYDYETILLNNNPATVSTDFALADKLYFEPITSEDVLQVIEYEAIDKVIVQFGGQTAINLVADLEEAGVQLLGSTLETIDTLEDRDLFYSLMNRLNIPHIPGLTATSEADLYEKAEKIGFPILLRPSYVIGGKGMLVLHSKQELDDYVNQSQHTNGFPILIDAYYPGQELEIDVVTDGKEILIPAIFEHIEKAGVHSGDSLAVTPPISVATKVKEKIIKYTETIAKNISFKGVFNIQFVMYQDELYVLEVNPRASRTVPVISKVTGVNMIELATGTLIGHHLAKLTNEVGLLKENDFYTVKAPVFSTNKLPGVDPKLVPEMKSTGELIAISTSYEKSLAKSIIWNEQTAETFKADDKQLYIVGEKTEFNHLQKRLKALGITCVYQDTDDQVTENLDYEDWLKTKESFAVFSSNANSMERERALEFGLLVMSSEDTLAAFSKMAKEEHSIKAIQQWQNYKRKEVVLQ